MIRMHILVHLEKNWTKNANQLLKGRESIALDYCKLNNWN